MMARIEKRVNEAGLSNPAEWSNHNFSVIVMVNSLYHLFFDFFFQSPK
jgi:hypothetical protein